MKATYDKEVDVLLVRLSSQKPDHGQDIGDGVIVHYDKNNQPVEIEILSAKRYLMKWLGQALDVDTKKSIVA